MWRHLVNATRLKKQFSGQTLVLLGTSKFKVLILSLTVYRYILKQKYNKNNKNNKTRNE